MIRRADVDVDRGRAHERVFGGPAGYDLASPIDLQNYVGGLGGRTAPTRYYWPQSTGRPRERWRVSDYPAHAELDANAIRQHCKETGKEQGPGCLAVRFADRAGVMHLASIAIESLPHLLYGQRWFLRCPRCGSRRVKLYITRTGPACRRCHRLTYGRNT